MATDTSLQQLTDQSINCPQGQTDLHVQSNSLMQEGKLVQSLPLPPARGRVFILMRRNLIWLFGWDICAVCRCVHGSTQCTYVLHGIHIILVYIYVHHVQIPGIDLHTVYTYMSMMHRCVHMVLKCTHGTEVYTLTDVYALYMCTHGAHIYIYIYCVHMYT